MRVFTGLLLGLLVLVVACTPSGDLLEERVEVSENEFLFSDVVSERVPADEISFFGVRLGDTEEFVRELHGVPDVEESYQFGRVVNLEYDFSLNNQTAVLYHTERGVVTAVLVPYEAQQLLGFSTLLNESRAEMYSVLGLPTLTRDVDLERVAHYDSLGYDVYTSGRMVDRIYFTTPNRGITPAGVDNESCAQVLTPARNPQTGECFVLPNSCVVPDEWEVVSSCDESRSAPELCVDVSVGAINPETGVCEEFLSTCDVPAGWAGCEDF